LFLRSFFTYLNAETVVCYERYIIERWGGEEWMEDVEMRVFRSARLS